LYNENSDRSNDSKGLYEQKFRPSSCNIHPKQLGWATAKEMGYSALWQCNTAEGDAARCYISGPRDEIIVLARGSTPYWTYWQGPMR